MHEEYALEQIVEEQQLTEAEAKKILNEKLEIFKYTEPELPEGCWFKISPSSIEKFYKEPWKWYKEQVLGETVFHGNTATHIGTLCHWVYEQTIKGKRPPTAQIEEMARTELAMLNKHREKYEIELIDTAAVMEAYYPTAKIVLNDFLTYKTELEAELQVIYALPDYPGICVGGTIDTLANSREIIDYKHIGKAPSKPDRIGLEYWSQLMAYYYVCQKLGYPVDKLTLVNAIKPVKSKDGTKVTTPARVMTASALVEPEHVKGIEQTISLMAETVLMAKKHPHLVPVLFKIKEDLEKGANLWQQSY